MPLYKAGLEIQFISSKETANFLFYVVIFLLKIHDVMQPLIQTFIYFFFGKTKVV